MCDVTVQQQKSRTKSMYTSGNTKALISLSTDLQLLYSDPVMDRIWVCAFVVIIPLSFFRLQSSSKINEWDW